MKPHSKGSQNCDDAWAITFSITLKYQTWENGKTLNLFPKTFNFQIPYSPKSIKIILVFTLWTSHVSYK
jgi:hypothetical protein